MNKPKKNPVERPLTKQAQRFCQEYIIDLNGTHAAIRAKYSPKSAESQASRLLTKDKVKAYIEILNAERSEKTGITAEYVIKRFQQIDEMDVMEIMDDDLNILPLSEWPKTWRTLISGIDLTTIEGDDKNSKTESMLKKIKWPDKVKNLEMLGRHFKLFTEKLEVEATVQITEITRKII